MNQERIGTTAREQLKWALRITYRTEPLSEGDKLNLVSELALFAGMDPHAASIRSDRDIAMILTEFRRIFERAVAHQDIDALKRPQAAVSRWDKDTKRYKQYISDSEIFETRAIDRLGGLILRFGHLLKACEAPEKMKPGRKAKSETPRPRGKCGNRFLAVKETQLYCSPACLDRALAARAQKELGKPRKKTRRRFSARG